MTTEAKAYEALRTAQIHEEKGSMVSSAKLCTFEAERAFNRKTYELAHGWALKSLSYSVGIFHVDHARIKAL